MKKRKHKCENKRGLISVLALEAEAIGHEAMTIFICGMGSATLAALVWLYDLAEAVRVDPFGAACHYVPMLEYIMMAYLIVIAGTLVFDLLVRSCRTQ